MSAARPKLWLSLAVVLILVPCALEADPPEPPVAPGYHNVPIKTGGRTAYVQVKDTTNPFAHLRQTDDRNSNAFSLNRISPLSNQSYDLGPAATASPAAVKGQDQMKAFEAKSYFEGNHAPATTWKAYRDDSTEAFGGASKSADYNKTFATARADLGEKTAGEANSTSEYTGRAAQVGGHDVKIFASSLGDKTYDGPEEHTVKRDLAQMNGGMEGLKDLPNRALTIDEVRALINHGIKPNTEDKPPEPSKALDDPDYMPDAAPSPLRALPGDDQHLKDFNDEMIPPPGMMAHPEAAEALPQETSSTPAR